MGKTIGKAYKLSSLSFLVPAYNDTLTIETVIREAIAVGKRVAKTFEVIVIDDGSTSTVNVGTSRHVRVIRHAANQGYGKTIKELYYTGKGEWLFTIPGDYQVGARELEKLIPHGRSADMLLGWRVDRHDPVNRRIVSWVYNTLLRMFFGITLHDINSVRLMRRLILEAVTLRSSSAFVDAELVIRARKAGFRVMEVPITHRARQGAGHGGGNQWPTIMATIREMVRFAYEEHR